jgi:hypothetical protein
VDRRALPVPENRRTELSSGFAPPSSRVEKTIAVIWREVLSFDEVGIDDNFLELGGHSLHAAQIVARVASALGTEVPIRTVFEDSTVRRMALRIAADPVLSADNVLQARTRVPVQEGHSG